MEKILIIEDDADIAEIEQDYLLASGFESDIASDGTKGLELQEQNDYSLVLLDLMLPGIDGFTVCRKMREKTDIPILMVTARKEDIDKIRGLGLGADDYIEKPFSPGVLVARVKANIAQYKRLKESGESRQTVLGAGPFSVNTSNHMVYKNGEEVILKNKEYELFLFLIMNAEMVFSKDAIYERIWGFDSLGDTATVAVHINRLREKLEDDPANPKHIMTVWGVGYKFKAAT